MSYRNLLRKQSGFTLIELIIVMVIILILTAIAIPSYRNYVLNARHSDAQVALMDLATRLDRYFTQNNTYVGAAIPALYPATSPQGYYNIAITAATATAYTVTATPTGPQASDTICGTYTYNSQAQKTISGTGPLNVCW